MLKRCNIPIPENSDLYEKIVRDCLNIKYSWNLQQYGSLGQTQYGIDLYGDDGVVCQCKNYKKKRLEKAIIENDAQKAFEHFDRINMFVIATTASRDTRIDDYIIELKNNYKETNFVIIYWDELERIMESNPSIYPYYYQFLMEDNTNAFIREFICICDKHDLFGILNETDFITPFKEKILLDADNVIEKMRCLISSDLSHFVKKEVLSDVYKFLRIYGWLTENAAIYSQRDYHEMALPSSDLNDEQRDTILKTRDELFQIYAKYKFTDYSV